MTSEAQRRASAKYQKLYTKQINIKFSPLDMDLYEWAKAHGNAAGYLKSLIREDRERHLQSKHVEP